MRKIIRNIILFMVFLNISANVQAQYFKPVWVNDIGGTGDSKATNIAPDNNGNIYISGYIRGTVTFNLKEGGTKTLTSNGDADVYIAKYNSTTGNYVWAISMGGPGLEQPNSMAVDNLGNVLITGQFAATVNFNPKGNFNLTSNGADDIFIAKYTSDGNFIWAKSMGGTSIDRGHYIAVDSQNNVFITASYTTAIDVDPSSSVHLLPDQNSLACFFAKYDANGNFLWAHPLGAVSQQNLTEITIDKATNDVVIAGDFSGNVDFSYSGQSNATFNSPGISNFVARYANDGTYKWVRYLPGSGSGVLASLKTDSQSNIVITGNFGGQFYPDGPSGSPISSIGASDLLLASYKADGTLNWARNFGYNSGTVTSRYVTIDAGDNIYVTGFFTVTLGFFTATLIIDPTLSDGVLTNVLGGTSVFIAGFSSSGKAFAAGALGSSSTSNLGYEIAVVNNNIFVAGAFCRTVDFDTGDCQANNFNSINGVSDSFLADFTIAEPIIASITGFTIPQQISISTIDQVNHKIAVTVAPGTDVTALTPTIILGNGTVNPASGVVENFTLPVVYTVSACAPVQYTVTVSVYPAKMDTTCSGTTIVITGDATASPIPDSYTWQLLQANVWTNAPGLINNKDYQGSAFINNTNANITYQLRRQISVAGVISYDSFYNVTVAPLIAVTNNVVTQPAVTSFCLNGDPGNIAGSTPVGGTGVYSYQWQSSADNVTFTNITTASSGTPATSPNFDPPVISVTTYYRRLVSSGICSLPLISNVITIIVNPLPSVTAQGVSICLGFSTTLTATSADQNAIINWYAAASGGSILFTGKTFTTPVLNSNTTYYAEASDTNTGCTSVTRTAVAVQIIQQLAAPVVSIQSTTFSSITFNWRAVTGATGYQVSIDNGQTFNTPSSGNNGLTHTVSGLQPQQSVTLLVRAIGNSNCQLSNSSTAVTAVTVSAIINLIFVPNAFTPNGDGKNDVIYVHSEDIKSLKFYIYDQWGELIYTSLSQQNGWDGTYKGTKQPVGVYVYYLEAIMTDGQQVTKKGTIALLR